MHIDQIKPMNASQDVLHDLLFRRRLVEPKRIAYRLHKAENYLSDICRRDRVDFVAIFNEILREAKVSAGVNPQLTLAVAAPIASLLFDGTGWFASFHSYAECAELDYERLCEQTGVLCEDLGTAIKTIARIERDGEYDARDDADIAECQSKIGLLCERLRRISIELTNRRTSRSQS